MADIFISYAHEDEARVQPLAHALEQAGWSIFWDRRIPAGQTWRSYIGQALIDARCVIVAWSNHSVTSRWVTEEADDGQKRGILVPVLLDSVEPPIGFRSIQAANLADWQSDKTSPRFNQLVHDINAVFAKTAPATRGDATVEGDASKSASTPKRRSNIASRLIPYLSMAAILVLTIGGGYWGYLRWAAQSPDPGPEPTAAIGKTTPPDTGPEATPTVANTTTPATGQQRSPDIRLTETLVVSMFQNDGQGLSVIDLAHGAAVTTIPIPDLNTRSLSVNPNRAEVYVSLTNGNTFYIVDTITREIRHKVRKEVGWNSGVSVVSPDGGTVYLATSGGKEKPENKVLAINTRTGDVERVHRLGPYDFPDGLGGLAISPDGRLLFTVDKTAKELLMIDATSGRVRRRLKTEMTSVLGVSTQGDAFYAIGPDGLSKLEIDGWGLAWHATVAGTKLASAGGQLAVSDSNAGRVAILNDESGEILRVIDVPHVEDAAFSDDGLALFAISGGFTKAGGDTEWLRVYEVETGKKLKAIPLRTGGYPADVAVIRKAAG